MPWKEETVVSQRATFVRLAMQEGANISELCRRFGVSRKTAYKWLRRYQDGGSQALRDRRRRPHTSPGRTSPAIEAKVLAVRLAHPTWGGRKIQAWLRAQGEPTPESPNTITAVLHRYNQIDPKESKKHRPFQRFEKEHPNQLWQMDFKGYFALARGQYCHPLTILDDHSRFLLGLRACSNERARTVQAQLTAVFRCYGLPERMLMDNGPPWGDGAASPYTILSAWLIRLGIRIGHSGLHHPQTLGKDERLHRTLKEELLTRQSLADLAACQNAFDSWRDMYNLERPHEALAMQPPISRYRPSSRPFPEQLPPIVYDSQDIVRKVDASGKIYFRNRRFRVGKAFGRYPVAIRPSDTDGLFHVFFCQQKVAEISFLEDNEPKNQL